MRTANGYISTELKSPASAGLFVFTPPKNLAKVYIESSLSNLRKVDGSFVNIISAPDFNARSNWRFVSTVYSPIHKSCS